MKMNNLINILLPMLYNQVFQCSLVQKKKKKKKKIPIFRTCGPSFHIDAFHTQTYALPQKGQPNSA